LAQVFSKSSNRIPLIVLVLILLGSASIVGFFWHFGSPDYTDVGYQPIQPVAYSHKTHVDSLKIDCRYCHTGVERSAIAGVPPTQSCMNCHLLIGANLESLAPVRTSWFEGKPIEWIKVNKLPDYTYFDHSAHIYAQVGCETCHGDVQSMEVVHQEKSLSMLWCLDCHRSPEEHLRPASEITTMNYIFPENQLEFASKIIKEKNLNPPTMCSGCHR